MLWRRMISIEIEPSNGWTNFVVCENLPQWGCISYAWALQLITEQSGNISHSQTPSTYVNYFVCDL